MILNSNLELTVGQSTDAGLKSQNEDCIGLRIPNQPALTIKGAVAVIADGVSAAEAGKEASEMCVRNFISDYFATPDVWAVKTAGQKILLALNRWLVGQSQIKGHVSTLSALILKSQTGYIFHVGDTRIYRLRGHEFECLTQDHCIKINNDTVYLSRAMGMDSRLEMDYRQFELQAGDIFFLSSDGVHDYLSDKIIENNLHNTDLTFEEICQSLIKQALAAGSLDNLSCQMLRIDKLPGEDSQEIYQKLHALRFPPILEVGQSLDGYEVIKEIHASQRSQLYLVKDAHQNRLVMKTPSINYDDDPAYIERFVHEQWIGKRIDSPYVVKMKENQGAKTALYTLMEYIDGMTLEAWINENPRPDINEVVRLAELMSRGIRALHRKDILHQDIKPDNVIINRQGVPILIDFGSCYAAGIEEVNTPFEREDALGTAVYSAPETRFRMKKTTRSDVFSLAVVVYEMLTGKMPYGNQLEKLADQRKLHRLQYLSAQQFNPMVPYWMDSALEVALSPLPERRHSAMSEFINELKTPNKKYSKKMASPFVDRNPLLLWQCIAAIEGLSLVIILKLWLG